MINSSGIATIVYEERYYILYVLYDNDTNSIRLDFGCTSEGECLQHAWTTYPSIRFVTKDEFAFQSNIRKAMWSMKKSNN